MLKSDFSWLLAKIIEQDDDLHMLTEMVEEIEKERKKERQREGRREAQRGKGESGGLY